MRWQLASTFALGAMCAACYTPDTVECGDFLCPEGQVCAEPGYCGAPRLVDQCFAVDAPAFTSCTYSEEQGGSEQPGVCMNGVCGPCAANPDLAGCGSATWRPMTSPLTDVDLRSVWVFEPASGGPATRVFIGGVGGAFLEYDGIAFRAAGGPDTNEDITALWASSESNAYALTANTLFRYDGMTWVDVTADLPAGFAGSLRDVTGTSADDVFVVGLAGLIARFDGSAWTEVSSTGPTWNAAIATPSGLLAVGTSGNVRDESGAVTQPLPSPHTTITIRDVFLNGDVPTLVGTGNVSDRVSLFERQGTAWVLAAPADGISGGVPLNTGWRNFAAGGAGEVVRRDAAGWTALGSQTLNELGAMGGAGDDVFAVGLNGTILRYSGP